MTGCEVPRELAEEMFALGKRLVRLLSRLSRALWDRAGGVSGEVVTLWRGRPADRCVPAGAGGPDRGRPARERDQLEAREERPVSGRRG
ncbi:hypothetical protein [Nonomuraea sp. JJY05]|uniref:hypothetical protein n=1 Tax=Nonomuraea sp. JJY05 TaxID=3350255 RepID=UPI0037478F64